MNSLNQQTLTEDLVSVIMPAYKTEKYIAESIQSVVNQSYKNWELLIANDCSPDLLEKIVLPFCKRDSRIHYFKLEKNSGPSAARNLCLEKARGRYIAMLDSNDIWHPQKLEKQLAFMLEKNVCFSFTSFQRINSKSRLISKPVSLPKRVTHSDALKNSCIPNLTVVLDRACIGNFKFKPDWKHEDYILWLSFLEKGITAYCLAEPLAFYRVLKGSLSANKFKSALWVWRIFKYQQKISFFRRLYLMLCWSQSALRRRLLSMYFFNSRENVEVQNV